MLRIRGVVRAATARHTSSCRRPSESAPPPKRRCTTASAILFGASTPKKKNFCRGTAYLDRPGPGAKRAWSNASRGNWVVKTQSCELNGERHLMWCACTQEEKRLSRHCALRSTGPRGQTGMIQCGQGLLGGHGRAAVSPLRRDKSFFRPGVMPKSLGAFARHVVVAWSLRLEEGSQLHRRLSLWLRPARRQQRIGPQPRGGK